MPPSSHNGLDFLQIQTGQAHPGPLHWLLLLPGMSFLQISIGSLPHLFEVCSQKAPSHRSRPWLLFLKFKLLPLDIFLSSSMPFVFQFCHLLVHSIFYQLILYTTYLSPRKHTPQRPGFFFLVYLFTDSMN